MLAACTLLNVSLVAKYTPVVGLSAACYSYTKGSLRKWLEAFVQIDCKLFYLYVIKTVKIKV